MENADLILADREKKNNYLKKYLNDYQVVTLKANIPGPDKNIKEAYVLINYFDNLLKRIGLFKKEVLRGFDGPMYIYLCSKNQDIKKETIKLEENDFLGRFVDLDVYNNSFVSLNRKNLRKCYLCGEPAFICARTKKHSLNDLKEYLCNKINIFLSQTIYELCDESILQELHIHPKFGLVTPYTNGSHQDMNYSLMITAKNQIKKYFVDMFFIGYRKDNLSEIFLEIRNIGMAAEQAMFSKTNQVNAYKGLIFDLGLIVTAVGYQLNNHEISIFEIIKEMTKGITLELESGTNTFGKLAYQKYHVGGARKEAESGFLTLQKVLKQYEFNEFDSLKALINIIYLSDDTVLLKRCKSLLLYNQVRLEFKKLLDDFNLVNLNNLNKYCIMNNLSFGGSADLLICGIFLKKLNKTLSIY